MRRSSTKLLSATSDGLDLSTSQRVEQTSEQQDPEGDEVDEEAERQAQLEQFNKLSQKLDEVRRKQRVKRLLREDLIRNGAESDLAKSYIRGLEYDDLMRVIESQIPQEEQTGE